MDMKLLTWLTQKLNAEKMILELGGGKSIPVNKHTIWCVFQIPRAGRDPPTMTDEEARARRSELGQLICPSTYGKYGIRITDIEEGFKSKKLVCDLGVRAFFMAAFQSLLFSNIDTHIQLEDVIFTEDIDNIGKRNWCKAIIDNLSRAARLFKKDFPIKGINTP
jgi:hypothetical protein